MPQKRCSSQSSDSSVEILDKRSKNRSKKQDHQFKTSSSSSPEPNRKSKNKISELDQERTKNYDFTDEVNGMIGILVFILINLINDLQSFILMRN